MKILDILKHSGLTLNKSDDEIPIDIILYKDDMDEEDEYSMRISHNNSSGASYSRLKTVENISSCLIDYIESYL